MPATWEQARDAWARGKVLELRGKRIQNEVRILEVKIEDGGSYQIGDYTWDYDPPSVQITYRVGKGQQTTITVPNLEFGKLVEEIVGVTLGLVL